MAARGGLTIRLLGPPCAERGGVGLPFAQKRGWLILGYLAIERRADRTRLAERVWPDRDLASAKGRLRRVLSDLNRGLGDVLIDATGEQLALTKGARAAIDICQLRDGLARRRTGMTQDTLDPSWLPEGEGELLAGLDDEGALADWLISQREACRQLVLAALDVVAGEAMAAGRLRAAEDVQRRRVGLDPSDENAAAALARTLAAQGRVTAARATLQTLERQLHALGVEPSAQTRAVLSGGSVGRVETGFASFPAPPVRYLVNDGVHLAYTVFGEGPVDVLVVPGFVTHLEQGWAPGGPGPFFQTLARRARLVFFDRRGIGLSDRLGHCPNIDETLSDMRAVLDTVGSERVVMAGFSEGGPLCIELAACDPHRCAGLFLYGTTARGAWAPDHPFALDETQFRSWCDRLIADWGGPAGLEVFAPGHGGDERLAAWWSRLLRSGATPSSLRVILDAIQGMDVRDRLASIDAPTVVVHRRGDRAVRVEAGRYLAAGIPGARWVELEGNAHWWWLGESEPVAATLLELIEVARRGAN